MIDGPVEVVGDADVGGAVVVGADVAVVDGAVAVVGGSVVVAEMAVVDGAVVPRGVVVGARVVGVFAVVSCGSSASVSLPAHPANTRPAAIANRQNQSTTEAGRAVIALKQAASRGTGLANRNRTPITRILTRFQQGSRADSLAPI